MTQVVPIEQRDLPEVGQFLHENLNRRFTPESWSGSLTHPWTESRPNYGMQLRDGDHLVGVFCAIYSDQTVAGQTERFCNPHSWCVLDRHRNSGVGLVLQLLKQRGYHFTMYTPNPKVAEIFRGLRFRDLDPGLIYFPNLPSSSSCDRRSFVETQPARIEACLSGTMLSDFLAHRAIPWLSFVAFGRGDDACLAVYKRGRWKKLPCAMILHLSDAGAIKRHGHLLRHHLLVHRGLPVSRVETRFLSELPVLAHRELRTQPKLVLSSTLNDGHFSDLYSELVALDV